MVQPGFVKQTLAKRSRINHLYQRRSFVLRLIDGIYMILGLGIAGMIMGGWR
jgi:hypothetical protein